MKKSDLLRLVAKSKFKPCTEFDPRTRLSRSGLMAETKKYLLFIYGNTVEYVSDSGKYFATLD